MLELAVSKSEVSVSERLDTILEKQQAACRRQRVLSADQRRDAIARVKKIVTHHKDALIEAVNRDFGHRSRMETELCELMLVATAADHARSHVKKWMKPRRRGVNLTSLPGSAWVQHEPLGVLGIISPWNYPLLLTLSPLIDALAAGNRVMIKPSELTPQTSALMAQLIETYFDEEEVAVVTGGIDIGAYFSTMPFDHLLFTGSTSIGRRIALAAAENLTPTTLELGGKSPAIVCDDYSMDKAVRSIALGKFINAGQTCIAPDYVLVPKGTGTAFAEALIAEVKRGIPDLASETYTGIVNERHLERLEQIVTEAARLGGKVLTAGQAPVGKMSPTVILNPPNGVAILEEEIFGPVLPIVEYSDLDDALRFINDRTHPLALYVFTKNKSREKQVLSGAISGGVSVNSTLLHLVQHNLPFGGVGHSGSGAYHGEDGFKRFSHARSVFKVGPLNSFEMLGPPFGRLAKLTTNFFLRKS